MAGIYIHIPFCKRRCAYCDFFSTTQGEAAAAYVDAVCEELRLRKDYLGGDEVGTIYFGGGTPSQLSTPLLGKIIEVIYNIYKVRRDAEITLEANPDDLTADYLRSISSLPFNRLSMGVQTFSDEVLRLIGRRHTAEQAMAAFRRCRESGLLNISIDLMYGLPGQTLSSWQHDLVTATSLRPEHISAYLLTYEEGTALWGMRERGSVREADEELSAKMFDMLREHLGANGYEHYEISNFCLPGMHSRHNSSYWTGEKYLGCGAGAHSYDGVTRSWNVASLERYVSSAMRGRPEHETETLDATTRYNEFVITSMRTLRGMPLDALRERFGRQMFDYCMSMAAPHLERKTVEIVGGIMRLTARGVFVSDDIMSDLLWV